MPGEAGGWPAASAAPSDPPGTDEPLQTSRISAFLLLPSTRWCDVMIPDKQRNICIANSNISLASLREREKKPEKASALRWFRGSAERSAERSSTVSLSCNRLFICLENNEENNPNNSCHILSVYCMVGMLLSSPHMLILFHPPIDKKIRVQRSQVTCQDYTVHK